MYYFNHAQIHCDKTRRYTEFGGYTHFLPPIQSLNVKKFYGQTCVETYLKHIAAMLKRDLPRNKSIFNHTEIHFDETR